MQREHLRRGDALERRAVGELHVARVRAAVDRDDLARPERALVRHVDGHARRERRLRLVRLAQAAPRNV